MNTDTTVYSNLSDDYLGIVEERWERYKAKLLQELKECDENLCEIDVEKSCRGCYDESVKTTEEN